MTRYDAYCALLALPDPPEMPCRTKCYVQPGSRHRDRLKRDLERAYLRHRAMEHGEDAVIISVRRSALRLVKRA